MDGVLYIRITDPYKASYGVERPLFAVSQLAQTAMRSELGKMSLDRTFAERDEINVNIRKAINDATESWGLTCLRYAIIFNSVCKSNRYYDCTDNEYWCFHYCYYRYEIRDIIVPPGVKAAMELQAEAERRKRASILESEGINNVYHDFICTEYC